jgi:phosphatidylserine/phosphatidylglycerophosphate/cardiolipin synthase-like enzyme
LQDNNCLVVASAGLARAYTAMFEDLISAPSVVAPSAVPKPAKVGGASLTPLFSPSVGEGLEDRITAALENARSVRVLAFLMSDPGILDALAAFSDPGADIRGVFDPGGMKDATRSTHQDPARFWFLKDDRFVGAPSHPFNPAPGHEQDFMHNKVMIIDEHLVVAGSYNFSENAETNDENVLLIDSAPVASAYAGYFDTLFSAYRRRASGRQKRAS